MKTKLLILLLIMCSCSVYEPVKMNYHINIDDHGSILCHDYKVYQDSLVLIEAGRLPNKIYQRKTSNVKFINWPAIMIVEIK